MSFVIGRCKHDPTKYCKNWDGTGNILKVTSPEADAIAKGVKCPRKHKDCPFMVIPNKAKSILGDNNG